MLPKVYNIADENRPDDCVYIGRGSKYGNPYRIGVDGTRKEVIEKYAEYIESNKILKEEFKKELNGKNLVCFCAPKPCHGDYLLQISNIDETIQFE